MDRLRPIDGLRGLAVLGVLTSHAWHLPFARHEVGWGVTIGMRGVDLFFVLSGFCLAYPTLRRMHLGAHFSFGIRDFAVKRLWRIAPPYYISLALFAVLSYTAFGLPDAVLVRPSDHLALLKDALFITDDEHTYNGALWTLGIELRWYVFFPIALWLFATSKPAFWLTILASYLLNAASLVPSYDLGTLPAFMLGIVAADEMLRGRTWKLAPYLAVAAFAIACVDQVAFHHGTRGHPTEFIWHLAVFLIVLSVVTSRRLGAAFSWRPLVFLGVASYSVYLVHVPFQMYLERGGVPSIVCLFVSLVIGIGFWAAVERPLLAWRSLRARHVPRAEVVLESRIAPDAM